MAKSLFVFVIAFVAFGAFLVQASPLSGQLGARQCTWGPSFWCSNITNAKGCHAVSHCIQTVWEHQNVPVDDDSICTICKDMVKQARDQLRSNETMDEIKQVFEGSCKLIPLKVITKECCKLADDFIPELVEALSSEMNPDQVCSVAGLCNSARIDELLQYHYAGALSDTLDEKDDVSAEKVEVVTNSPSTGVSKPTLSCGNCNAISNLITSKFRQTNRDDILENMLHLCGHMSSFSDACANIVLTYFNDIYDHMEKNMDATGICHLSGTCVSRYHQHAEDPKEPEPLDLAALTASGNDDIPCELCEQLVRHLREVLTANTTEAEFKQVLEGLCNQTKGFKDECLSLANQYYAELYEFLVKNLDEKGACFLIGVCPKGNDDTFTGDIMPLLPVFPPARIEVQIRKKLGAHEPKFTQEELQSMALPIDHLMGAANPGLLVENGQLCTLCEMVLHFVQVELATPATDDEIKRTVSSICDKFGSHIRGECHNFIDMYGDAVIALLIQGLDPREICPKMQMCPHNNGNRLDMEVLYPEPIKPESDETDKPTCPLCLFAVQQAQEEIKNDKSKTNIKHVLSNLCSHLPNKLKAECNDFVETYTNELIDMLITDFKPQEICVALKLCPKSHNYLEEMGISVEEDDNSSEEKSEENEISKDDLPLELVFDQLPEDPRCVMCEEFVRYAEKKINKHSSKAEIVKALHHSCDKMRKRAQEKCNKFVDHYGDKIAALIQKGLEPKMVCRELGMCLWSEKEDLDIDEALKYDVIALPDANVRISHDRLTGNDEAAVSDTPGCVLCEFVMTKLENDLKNKTTEDEIKHTIETVCQRMPKSVSKQCEKFVEEYADAIMALITSVPPKEVCKRMQLCMQNTDTETLTQDSIECGVCYGASMSLIPYVRKQEDHTSISTGDMVAAACENLPAKYYSMCKEMVTIYGPSIMNLASKHEIDEAHVCAEIGKCFENEYSRLAFARISA